METETNELIQELADWMVTCAAEGTKNGPSMQMIL